MNLDVFDNQLNCSTHFDEIFLLFKGHNIPFLQVQGGKQTKLHSLFSQRHTDEDQKVSSLLLNWWTNFAKYLNPNGISEATESPWTPLTSRPDSKYMEISTEGGQLKQLATLFPEVRNFFEQLWDVVPPRMHLPR